MEFSFCRSLLDTDETKRVQINFKQAFSRVPKSFKRSKMDLIMVKTVLNFVPPNRCLNQFCKFLLFHVLLSIVPGLIELGECPRYRKMNY